MMGNALDELGRNKEAIEIYRAALKQQPNTPMLHYNLAVSLKRAGKNTEAKTAVQEGLRIAPDHPSSHVFLGGLYQEMGYRIPAILAYSRFLALEPDSARAANVMPVLLDLLTRGVNKGKQQNGTNEINIILSETPKGLKDEGDFAGVEMMMSIMMAADLIDLPKDDKEQAKPKAPRTGFEKLVSIYESMGEALENAKPRKGFALTYYAPYFSALAKEEHVEAFAAHAWRAGKIDGSADWLKANESKMSSYQAWSKSYACQAK
jgi:tetratricopeptide (TPR) repeat protein